MTRDFYPFVEKNTVPTHSSDPLATTTPACEVECSARVAVYDDAAAAPRVVVVDPAPVRDFLEELTATVTRLVKEQGGTIPFMVIREIVENLVHAYFCSPTVSILDNGNTIRFTDRGPGIKEKTRALEYGTTSATEEMRQYIRGVGSGLPYVQQYMSDKGGSLLIEDNISGGTVVTISTLPADDARLVTGSETAVEEVVQPSVVPTLTPQMSTYSPVPTPYPGSWNPAPIYSMPHQQPAAVASSPGISLDERAQQALSHFGQGLPVGPTELVKALGSSAATWSRCLTALAAHGLIVKDGQKYRLTPYGMAFLQDPTRSYQQRLY